MKLTVTSLNDIIVTLEVNPDMELANFKALCEYEVGFPAQEIIITHEGRPLLDNNKELKYFGIKEGDLLLIQQASPNAHNSHPQLRDLDIGFSSVASSNNHISQLVAAAESASTSTFADTAERLRQELTNNPDQIPLLKQNNPSLADAFLSENNELFARVLREQVAEKSERERKRIQMLNAGQFDQEYQKLISEEIRQDNVDSNMEAAIEHHPESFGQVTMLYIDCKVNSHPVKAYIDSGAQTTIMSKSCAERCNIMRLLDKRWAGYAKGVGVQKILGRVHLAHIEIGGVFLKSSFSILEEQIMDMILGLDMLKRYQCSVDLKRNVLVIGTTGTKIPFLN